MDDGHHQLKRGLKNRHIQLIALGGAIGTGLFLGIASTIQMAGPSVLLGYAIAGAVAFLIMRQLGEMIVAEPVAGSFSHFADKYCGRWAGFVSGWNYWVMYILVSLAELTALGIYMQYWFPELPTWVSALGFFVLVNLLSLLNVKAFGELEFWFAVIKVAAVVGMIVFGLYLLIGGGAGPEAGVSNLWRHGGFFPNGVGGLAMAMAVIMFSFGGLELIGITAAEADDPSRTIPRATNNALYRILIFYIGALAVLLMLFPWQKVVTGGSPFVLIFAALDNGWVANVLNLVVLTAALSVYNGCVYANSRMLFGLAAQGNAPRALMRTNARGVPLNALAVSAVATGSAILINYFLPEEALGMVMSLAVAALVINWAMISWSHLRFRRSKDHAGEATLFRSPWFPLSNYVCLAFVVILLVIMAITPGLRISVILIPIWLALLGLGFWLRERRDASTRTP
jgi:aromatic amino acid transport protein AroP